MPIPGLLGKFLHLRCAKCWLPGSSLDLAPSEALLHLSR